MANLEKWIMIIFFKLIAINCNIKIVLTNSDIKNVLLIVIFLANCY